MMSNSIENAIEEAAKVGYATGKFAITYFWHSSNLANLKKGFDVFVTERLEQRLEEFALAQKDVTKEQKKEFYEDLKYNQQNLNFLYEFVEKTRVTSFELHVKILAALSVEFIANKDLNYYQICLLTNVNTFNEIDFQKLYEVLDEKYKSNENKKDTCTHTKDPQKVIALNKFINAGVLSQSKMTNLGNLEDKGMPVDFAINEFSKELYEILDDIFKGQI
jgi:hypothetical protein